jgi:hypothetical protein
MYTLLFGIGYIFVGILCCGTYFAQSAPCQDKCMVDRMIIITFWPLIVLSLICTRISIKIQKEFEHIFKD